MSSAIKIVYSAFMALDDEEKKEFIDYLEDQIESEKIFQAMQQGDQRRLTNIEMNEMLKNLDL